MHSKRKKILVMQPKMIGDVLASSVICLALKQHENYHVDYLVNSNTAAVVQNHPAIDQLIVTDASKNSITDFIALGLQINKQRYDIIIDPYGIWETTIPILFSRAPLRIGFKKWYTRLFYNKLIIPEKDVSGSAIHHRLQLAEAVTGIFSSIRFPKIYLQDTEINRAKKILETHADANKPLIMISVLGSGTDKSMPYNMMAEMLDRLANTGDVQLIFNYMPAQEKEALQIYRACKPATQRKIITSLYTKSLREFLAVLSLCDALVGNEGGAVNMAKALDIPTFTLFSPWISKTSWNMLEDHNQHIAIHLCDYFPAIYSKTTAKKLRAKAANLYPLLSLHLYEDQLVAFIARITKKNKT